MANKNIIVIKKPDLMVHTDYLARAVKEATYLGTSLVHDGNLIIDHQQARPTVEGVVKLMEAKKDSTVVFCFGENKTILREDMQPYLTVLNKDAGHSIAVFLEGNFNGFRVKDSSHTDEFHCFEDFLSKKLPKIYKACGGDMKAFLEELNDPITQQDFSNSWTDRGFMTFLTSEGQAVSIANKGHPTRQEYHWGMTSNSLNYIEKEAAKPEDKAPDKPLSLLEKLQAKVAGTKPPNLPAEQKTETAIAILKAADEEMETVSLPKEANDWKNATKIDWWMAEVGYKPEKYKDLSTKVQRKKGTKLGVLAPLAATNTKEAAIEAGAASPINPNKVDPKTLPDKVSAEAPENVKDLAPKHVSIENMPILSPRQKLLVRKQWKDDAEIVKVLGDDFQALAFDPKKIKEFEDAHQTFYAGLGMPENTKLSFEAMMLLGATELKALAQLAFNLQNNLTKAEIKLKSILTNPENKIKERLAM